MKYLRSRLGLKLFLTYLIVMLVGLTVLWITTKITTPRAFAQHLAYMEERVGIGFGANAGQGKQGTHSLIADFYENFQKSFDEALLISMISAGIVAIGISWLLTRSITSPVQAMMSASRRISEGHYDERVEVRGADELAQLADRFNQMASQLEQVEKKRRQLIGDVTHELRTPLTSIKGYMEGLVDGVLPASPETYDQIHKEASRLARLVDDLQELSRVESQAFNLNFGDTDLSLLIGTILKRLSPQAMVKRISLRSNLPAHLPHVLADEDRITQVITNLTANALQYTPNDGEVVISAHQAHDEVVFSIKDTGLGISAEHIPNLFTRFYRVDKSRSRNAGGGSGIGLTIARHLVEAHGGRIWVESEGEGKGSTFSFSLKVNK